MKVSWKQGEAGAAAAASYFRRDDTAILSPQSSAMSARHGKYSISDRIASLQGQGFAGNEAEQTRQWVVPRSAPKAGPGAFRGVELMPCLPCVPKL